MTVWKDINDQNLFGIAISNFEQDEKPNRLNLNVGDSVVILKETTHWYYGYNKKDKQNRGIFPKSYVQVVDCILVKGELVIQRSEIVEEITKVLTEWGLIFKTYFLTNHKDFQSIRQKMFELIRLRSSLLSGNLPVDEMREIKLLATSQIDTGNNILNLDMVVRDSFGNILDVTSTCTTELYQYHNQAVDRIRQANSTTKQHISKPMNKHSHNLLLTVHAFVCKFQEDSDLLFVLYDGDSHTPITENYVVKWGRQGIARDIDQFDNNRVLFTDLSTNDLNQNKIYLVCYAIRIGSMEMKDNNDSKRTSITNSVLNSNNKKHSQLSINSNSSTNSGVEHMRRPFGVACKDLTPIIRKPEDFKNNLDLPFILCEKENLDNTLKKLIANKDIGKFDSKLAVSVEVLHGDIKQIKEEFPHLIHGNVPFARKMGFPEVILPGDVRNDLYLTIVSGEFSKGTKSHDKNIEMTAYICNEKGENVPGVITLGAGCTPIDDYKSVVYHHEDKPKWLETFKIHVPIDEFKNCHLKFLFRHRSSNENKDRSEKHFALAYAKLMQDNGTTIPQGLHKLAVYKIDPKKFDKNQSLAYMDLPWSINNLPSNLKPSSNGLTLAAKHHLQININLCSTKLTQNVALLGLLNWSSHKDLLEESLKTLKYVPAEEMVKFLQDVLDALFNILVENDNPEKYDHLVFMSIIRLIEIVNDIKYQHFQTVLDLYINESFSATLAYNKLIDVLKSHLREAITAKSSDIHTEDDNSPCRRLYRTTKYLHYIMKFIIRSRILFAELNDNALYDEFENKLEDLLLSFIDMIACPNDLLQSEGALLKNLHIMGTDLAQVYDPVKLSYSIIDILNEFPPLRLTQSKMNCIKEFVDSKLFQLPQCREVLLPMFCKQIKDRLESKEEGDCKSEIWQQEKNLTKAAKVLGQLKSELHTREYSAQKKVSECVNIMNNILKLLYRKDIDIGPIDNDIKEVMLILLRTVIQTSIAMERDNPLVGNLVAIMLGILHSMERSHYDVYVKTFNTTYDLQDFLTEILLVFKDLVSKSVFKDDWMDMIMHQNTVILKSLKQLSIVIFDCFFDRFEKQVWSNFFQCSIAFLIQPQLQLNLFSENKVATILARYKDIRKEAAFEIQRMWHQLGTHKRQFVPQLVGEILEMSMIPEKDLRIMTIPIFFDMMQCEFYSSKYVFEGYGDTKRNNSHIKANFNEFEKEMIEKLDILIEGGRGDQEFKQLFHEIMMQLCLKHKTLNEEGVKFVNTVTMLIERLLEYRCIMHDESKENRMACTVSLLQFYSEVNRKEMYIRYVYKLCDLHMDFDNYTEAAFTLKLHSNLLKWNDTELSPLLRSHRHMNCRSHRQLKEALYYDIIDYFDRGKMWECAIDMCRELAEQYENEVFDYLCLSTTYKKMAKFFEKILKEMRHESEYFRVGFYGLKFPQFIRNKVFIYRGKEYERLSEFCPRILAQHPTAELMQTLTTPGPEITQSDGQFIQINSVEPMIDEKYANFRDKLISNEIVKYYNSNNVQNFKFSRPYREKDSGDSDVGGLWLERTILTTSYPLPGILRWFPIINSETFKISPIEYAIETMEVTNRAIRDLIILHKSDENIPINPLSMKINGIVDPAVMGGYGKYEEAFLTTDYLEKHPVNEKLVEKLKDLIASQIPLLEIALSVHKHKAPASLLRFHGRLEECFAEMQANIECRYGKRICDLKFDRDSFVELRRNGTMSQTPFDLNRLSETSMGSSDSGLSKSTSGNRPQTSSIKSTFNFNFNTSRTSLGHTPSQKNKTKEKNTGKRRSIKKIDRETLSLPISSSSQWYTSGSLATITSTPEKDTSSPLTCNTAPVTNNSDVFVLTEELTPKRPLRSEVEKERRLSRPASIATPTASMKGFSASGDTQSLSGGESSNRNSVESTSDDELVPPPLPAKIRDSSDLSSLPINMAWTYNGSFDNCPVVRSNSISNSTYEYVEAKNLIILSPDDKKRPPTPPPKPSRNSRHIP